MVAAKEIKESIKNHSFPKLMISDSGSIVLFISPTAGTVIKKSEYDHTSTALGEYFDNWDRERFTDYHGEVELITALYALGQTFPYLAFNDGDGSVFIVSEEKKGTILDPGSMPFDIGEHFSNMNTANLETYRGPIKLSNEIIKKWSH